MNRKAQVITIGEDSLQPKKKSFLTLDEKTESEMIKIALIACAIISGVIVVSLIFIFLNQKYIGTSSENSSTPVIIGQSSEVRFIILEVISDETALQNRGAFLIRLRNVGSKVIEGFSFTTFGSSTQQTQDQSESLQPNEEKVIILPKALVGESISKIEIRAKSKVDNELVLIENSKQIYSFGVADQTNSSTQIQIIDNQIDGDDSSSDETPAVRTTQCNGTSQRTCYSGPSGTAGIGVCSIGIQTCVNGFWDECVNEVTPKTELCGDGLDNNCNGQIDDNCISFDLSPRPFIALSFSTVVTSQSAAVQNQFYDVMLAHWGAGSVTVVPQSYLDSGTQYRSTVLARNPNVVLAPYYSAITTQNPINPSDYNYSSDEYNPPGTFNCPTPSTYNPNLDEEGFFAHSQEDQASWPNGYGYYGRWPFYYFKSRGWVLSQTTYLCRPIIDVGNPAVVNFVVNESIHAVGPNGRFPYANGIAMDNAAMVTNKYDHWPGKNEPQSSYNTNAPDGDFLSYLDAVKNALNQNNAKLFVNTGEFRALAGHVDLMLYEGDVLTDQTPAYIKTQIQDFKYAIDHNSAIVPYYRQQSSTTANPNPLDSNIQQLKFFLAEGLLVYEKNLYAFAPNMPSNNFNYYPEYFELPMWLQDPVGNYQEPQQYLFYRKFKNGVIVMNANTSPVTLSSSQLSSYGLSGYNVPSTIAAKTAVIRIQNCGAVTSSSRCSQLYQ